MGDRWEYQAQPFPNTWAQGLFWTYIFAFLLYFQAYVWENNVYIKTSPDSPPQQVTFNGEGNLILNGIPDWVYEGKWHMIWTHELWTIKPHLHLVLTCDRYMDTSSGSQTWKSWIMTQLHTFPLPEEMFSSNQGFWWSPGGKYVAYLESNDTGVHTIQYSWYGDNSYPSTVSIPYPKVGHPFRACLTLTSLYWDHCVVVCQCTVYSVFRRAWRNPYYLVYLTFLSCAARYS